MKICYTAPMEATLDPRIPRTKGAYMVGGSVRDMLLNRQPVDYDIAVLENPEKFARRLASRLFGRLVCIGKAKQTVFRVVSKSGVYDITPIHGKTIEDDLYHRDFTINAIACSLSSRKIIDVTDGSADLLKRNVRMISADAFRHDPIRLLRAYRLAADLNFTIEPATVSAIRNWSSLIRNSAGERIRGELFALLDSANSHGYLVQMADCGLLFDVFPEMRLLKNCWQNNYHRHDVFCHTMNAYAHLEVLLTQSPPPLAEIDATFGSHARLRRVLLKWALLLHDIGKPPTRTKGPDGRIRFIGHPRKGAAMADTISERFRLSKHEKSYVHAIISNHLRPLALYVCRSSKDFDPVLLTRLFVACGEYTADLLLHALADNYSKRHQAGDDAFHAFVTNIWSAYCNCFRPQKKLPRLVTGHDLIREFGLPPSPLFKKILDKIEIARLSRQIKSRSQAMALAAQLIKKHNAPI